MTPQALAREDCANILREQHEALACLRGERILVTGGTGFLGTWIAEFVACLNDEHDFDLSLVLLSSRAQTFREKAPHLARRGEILLIERDVRDVVDISESVTRIVHAAASPDSRLHASDPLHTAQVIVQGTSAILEAAARLPRLNSVLNVSSGWVYGDAATGQGGTDEEDWGTLDPSGIRAVYAESKRMAETICAGYRNEHRLPIVTVRPFSFMGPYQALDKPWAINNFLRDALLGGPIRILGDPGTLRSYLYASDMTFWVLKALASGQPGKAYNIGSPAGVDLKSLAQTIAESTHEGIEVRLANVHKDARSGAKFVPDVSRIQHELGVTMRVDLNEAIKRTLHWNKLSKPQSETVTA